MLRLVILVIATTALVSGSALRPIQPRKPVGECPDHQGSTPVYLADSDDCTIFYECDAAGNACPKECPPGTEFNPTLKVCDRPETANCKAGGSKFVNPIKPKAIHPFSPVGECHGHEDGTPTYLPDSDDCQIYYECSNNEPFQNHCPDDLQWNSVLNACDFPANVNCDKSKKVKPYSAVGQCPEEPESIPTYLPDDKDCSAFYECSNGVPIKFNCAQGDLFDSVSKICVLEANARCYSNADNNVEKRKSKPVQNYSPVRKSIRPKQVRPLSAVGTCPVPQGDVPKYLADSENCSIFYECDPEGNPVLQECAPGLEFNPIVLVCDWPSHSGCTASNNLKMINQARSAQHQKKIAEITKLRARTLPLKLH